MQLMLTESNHVLKERRKMKIPVIVYNLHNYQLIDCLIIVLLIVLVILYFLFWLSTEILALSTSCLVFKRTRAPPLIEISALSTGFLALQIHPPSP